MSLGKPLSFSHSESSNVSIFCNLQMEFGKFCMLRCLDKNRYLKWLKLPMELSNLIFESSTTQINLAPAGTWISWWMFTTNVWWWFPYLLDLVIEWSTISLVGVRINSGTNFFPSSTSHQARLRWVELFCEDRRYVEGWNFTGEHSTCVTEMSRLWN